MDPTIAIGMVSLLAVVTLPQDFAGAAGGDPGSFVTAGKSLVVWELSLGIYLMVKGFMPSGVHRLQDSATLSVTGKDQA
jgi:hypothetical protein